jgi:ABC-2 type transport system ATP-binding protein
MGLLAVEHVTKSFGATVAVKDVSFTVEPGEIFGVLGPNGAGKTTTIRMILDLIKPDSGQITVLGGPMTEEKKNRVGYLPEERGLYRDLKVLDCMVYLAMLKGVDRAVARRRALDYLERVGLADQQKKKISELSKGMQQKVQFGTAILHEPEIVIIDEPFSGLDPVNTLAVKEQIFALRKAQRAFLMSTHQMQMVEEMCDRLVMFNRGEIVLRGTPRAVQQQFAPNAVLVEGTGPFGAIQGVREVVPHNGAVQLMLEPGVHPQEILRVLATQPAVTVDSFQVATPSLDEVFVRVVQGESSREAGHE